MRDNSDLDAVHESDRATGSTLPESGVASSNVVGRPRDTGERGRGFHEAAETAAVDRESFSDQEALDAGGSFDGLGVPTADRASTSAGDRPN